MGVARATPTPNLRLRQARLARRSPSGSGRHLSRQELADLINAQLYRDTGQRRSVDANYIGKLERGAFHWPNASYRQAFRAALDARDDTELGFFISRPEHDVSAQASIDGWFAHTAGHPACGEVQYLRVPDGRVFPGAVLPMADNQARHDDTVPPTYGVVIDQRGSRRRMASAALARHRAAMGAPWQVPDAYVVDEITEAIVWAAANLDEALTTDDAELDAARRVARGYQPLPRSAASREAVGELTAIGQMWLGSQFCADHIQRRFAALDASPAFWTREQYGEEASAWLLFAHKYRYLQAIQRRADPSRHLVRGACIPREAVDESSRPERVLLWLAVALMEACGTQVAVCDEPGYAAIDGFVASGRRAVVANWVRADGLWYVDTVERRPTISEYRDAAGHAVAHSVITAPDPYGRLRRLADYLDLPWPWLPRRCAELAREGVSGLLRPRSRLLSTKGLDAACAFGSGAAG